VEYQAAEEKVVFNIEKPVQVGIKQKSNTALLVDFVRTQGLLFDLDSMSNWDDLPF
jgi:hypothetical protein